MKNHIKKFTGLLFVAIFIISCATYKKDLYHGNGTLEQARMNAIIDFANSGYKTPRKYLERRNGKAFDVFWIYEYEKAKDSVPNKYLLTFFPENQGYIALRAWDTIGKSTSTFPTKYVEYNNKLFLWHDSLIPLSREVIDVIYSYGILDSISIKRNLGLLPEDFEDTRMVRTDHSLKGVDYYICKGNISKYKKVKTNIGIGYYTPPKLDCSE